MAVDEGGSVNSVGSPEGAGNASTEEDRSKDSKDSHVREEELRKQIQLKRCLRDANLKPSFLDVGALKHLDSSIKKSTAVIKKLKAISEDTKDSLLEDLKVLNLSKYTSEAVTAVCEAKLKASDINAAVQICSLLHQRYRDFGSSLVSSLAKQFAPAGKSSTLDEPPFDPASSSSASSSSSSSASSRALRKRSLLRLLCELYLCGVFQEASVVIAVVKEVTNVDHLTGGGKGEKDRDGAHASVALGLTFAKYGKAMLGLTLGPGEEELYCDLSITTEQKKHLLKMMSAFYDAAVVLLLSEHTTLGELERENARLLSTKGEVPEEVALAYEKQRKMFDQLLRSVTSLAESLEKDAPVLPEGDKLTRMGASGDVRGSGQGPEGEAQGPEPIWDDEDTRSFYENLPDLRAFVPAVLLGGEAETPKAEAAGTSDSSSAPPAAKAVVDPAEAKAEGKAEKAEAKAGEEKAQSSAVLGGKGESAAGALEALLQRLPNCVSRDTADQFTVDFCYLNSKSHRRKLARCLFAAPRTSLELLPYYGRIAATLAASGVRDVGPALVSALEDEFSALLTRKDQINLESKLRNVRFVGELTKFKLAPPTLALSMLKSLLDDFSHHNVDMAACLLETCGRFLLRSSDGATAVRAGNLLDTMLRLKNAKNLDARLASLVDNAYYACRPPERSARKTKSRTAMQQYIRKLLFADLDKSSIERVLRQLRRLDWSTCQSYLAKCFLKVHRLKYGQLHLLASMAAGLGRYHDAFAVALVDQVLEEVRVGLEVNEYGTEQRRITVLRLLGEFYNYQLVDSPVVFDTMYLILYYGHSGPEGRFLDPPEDCFRIRLVITLLETCGHYFDRGSAKKRLDRFLLYFQHYILSKAAIPLDVEFDLQDLLARLRPKLVRFSTADEANEAIVKLDEEESAAAAKKETDSQQRNSAALQAADSKVQIEKAAQNVEAMKAGGVSEKAPAADEGEGESESEGGESGVSDGEEGEEDEGDEADEGVDDDTEEERTVGTQSGDEEGVKLKEMRSTKVDPEEEEAFEREFRSLMQESLAERKLEKRMGSGLQMTVPLMLFDGSGKEGAKASAEENGESNVAMRLLVKKGNKQQARQLFVPADNALVQASRKKEAEEAKEKEDIKRRVLAFNDREEEEVKLIVPQSQPQITNRQLTFEDIPEIGRQRPIPRLAAGKDGGSGRAGAGRPRRPSGGGQGRRR